MTDDSTLGGYELVHNRPPAFAGSDGRAYSAAVYVDDLPDADGRYGGALLFVRWSPEGDRADGHLETPYVAFGTTPEEAAVRVRALPLLEVKRQLDVVIAAQGEESHW